jgi:hypothetical protein
VGDTLINGDCRWGFVGPNEEGHRIQPDFEVTILAFDHPVTLTQGVEHVPDTLVERHVWLRAPSVVFSEAKDDRIDSDGPKQERKCLV